MYEGWVSAGIYKIIYANVTEFIENRMERFSLEYAYIL